MATLILTTVGSAVGGPIGGAVGAFLGNQVDQRWLAPRRQGPRLGALTVQTSAYGQPIPRLFGTMRVAGTVIWATDLKEDRNRSGGGKGAPKTTSYSYSASFAVALSARSIRSVRRIWADGKLLRGAAGDWKSETGFRLYRGDEAQDVDPLIAAIEGIHGTPAYRGLAYAVFEDMQLADFGNRIPSLTFEVEADTGAVPLATIAADLGGGTIGGDTVAGLSGYAATGGSVRAAIEGIAQVIPLLMRDDGSRLFVTDRATAPVMLTEAELGVSATGFAVCRTIERQAAGTLPDEVSITYYEPTRDYQAGLQRARRGGSARRAEMLELPAALNAGDAKGLAEKRLADHWSGRTIGSVTLPWRRLDLRPGSILQIGGSGAERWRIIAATLENMVLTLRLRAVTQTGIRTVSGRPGRAAPVADMTHGPTTVALLDLPPFDDGAREPRLWLAAAGISPGWRRAAVIVSDDEGASWREVGATAPAAVMGSSRTVLRSGSASLIDTVSEVEVGLLHDGMTLASCDDDALVGGANAAMLGDEMIQFGHARQVSGRIWRLSRLLRGRRGTEAAISGHIAGENFVLLDRDALQPIDFPLAAIGTRVRVIATGLGDPAGGGGGNEADGAGATSAGTGSSARSVAGRRHRYRLGSAEPIGMVLDGRRRCAAERGKRALPDDDDAR